MTREGGRRPVSKARAFLFDLDGVVVDNMKVHAESWRRFLARRGIRIDLEDFHERTAGIPAREVLAHYLGRRLGRAEVGALVAAKEALYRKLYRPAMHPLPGLTRFLRAARSLGIRLGLGSGATEDNVAFVLDGLKLREYFDSIVCATDVRRGKPHPDTFLRLAKKLGVRPSRCIVFEDALLGEEAARRARMRVVAVTTSHPARAFKQPLKAVHDFRRLDPASLA
ncbi:MAG: beta-phosphoglucomutase family hydrolase [Elusimicrobia bacterium]|nr:beta-phosphoglucomutase family hydrolase [Elusimicrobiota bacterium]